MTVFYRKYRPQRFSELVGQESVKETLLAQLSSGKISHGYLFSGPRGTGKTSTARIFAKAVNCTANKKQGTRNKKQVLGEPCNKCISCVSITNGSALDLIEIDAASNRGIDEIRDLREKIKLSPVSSRFKVYIIDEAHMLTTEAFNALLKTLEEPPGHAIFILCTTAASKLPKTILSRLSRFSFLRASEGELVIALKKIAKSENINVSDEALSFIAQASDGSFRDAVSFLDQLSSSGKKIRLEDVTKIASLVGWNHLYNFFKSLFNKNLKEAVVFVEEFAKEGGEISPFVKDLVSNLEKMLLIKVGASDFAFSDLDSGQKQQIEELSGRISFVELQNLIKLLLISESEIRLYPVPRIPLILALCKFCGVEAGEGVFGVGRGVEDKVEHDSGKTNAIKKAKVVDEETEKDSKAESKTSISRADAATLGEIENKWSDFLIKVKPVNAHLLALLRSTRPVEFDGANLTLEVFYKFHKEKIEEPKITVMLEGLLAEVFNKKMSLKTRLAQRSSNSPKSVVKSDVVETGEDISDIAAEIFLSEKQ